MLQLAKPRVNGGAAHPTLKRPFGVTRVVWLPEVTTDGVTGGHLDGTTRLIDEHTVVVPQLGFPLTDAALYDEAAAAIQAAGLHLIRMDTPGAVLHNRAWIPAIYVNWLVPNEVMVVRGIGRTQWYQAARAAVQTSFPGRDAFVIDTWGLWY